MTYEIFLDRLEQEILCRQKKEERIRRVRILKNNGVWLDGFCCQVQGHREQPTVYVNHYYREDPDPGEVEEIAELVLKIMRESALKPGMSLEEVMDYEKMRKHIFYRLISREQNRELLAEIPHVPWLDLAIVFYLRIPEHIVKNATVLVRQNHMKHWGVTLQELRRTAAENMSGVPVFLHPLEQFLEEYGLGDVRSGMYVLSNSRKEFGAAVIVDPKVQRMCAVRFGEDYYVLPSSIHELILLPRSMASSREDLDELVREVNESCVSREEVLSGHAYLYSIASGEMNF